MWEMVVAAVGAAVTTRASEDIGNAARFTWTAVFQALRRRMGTRAALIDAMDQEALEQAVQEIVDDDPVFAARIQALVAQARREAGEEPVELTVPSPGLPARRVVRQLPAGTADFVNRVAELSALDAIGGRGEAGANPIVVLRGTPGVGKTALALRWGHKRQDRFGGGQFYADLREPADPVLGSPEPASDALTSFLLAMGVPGTLMPDSFAARLSLFRTLSADEPVLVLLRGAALPAQISLFVPTAPGSMVVVSTQHDVKALVMDSAKFIDVGPLDDDAALELLSVVCGKERIEADPAEAKRLVALCGHLPVALRVVAGRLQLDPTMSVAELAAEVAGEPYALDALALPGESNVVEALFTTAYHRLSAGAQRLYRDLGAVPVGEVSNDLLQRIGWPDRVARQTAVEELLGLKLAERVSRDRYAMHPLIKAHAARLARDTAPGQADRITTEVVEYFCEFAAAADQAIMNTRRRLTAGPTGNDERFAGPHPRATALQEMEAHREDLLRIARLALAIGADDQVMRLATATQSLYFNHRHLADWIAMSHLAITAARRAGRHDVEIQIRCTLSRVYSDAGDLERAGAEVETAFTLLPAANDPILAGTAWEFRGRVLDLMARAAPESDQAGARDRAEAAFRTAIDIYIAEKVDRGAALGRLFLGIFFDATGRPADAVPHLEQARAGLNEAGDDRNATRADAAIGAAHLHLGHYRRAYEELAAAAAYFAAAELWHYELEVRTNLAVAAAALGDQAAAAEHAARAEEIRRLSAPGQ